MRHLIVPAVLLLAACQSAPVIREPVEVTRYVYVRIDPLLTQPLPIAEPRNDSGAELLRVARDRKAGQQSCNARLQQISEIEGREVP